MRLWETTTEFVECIPQSLILRSVLFGWILIYQNWSIWCPSSVVICVAFLQIIITVIWRFDVFICWALFSSLLLANQLPKQVTTFGLKTFSSKQAFSKLPSISVPKGVENHSYENDCVPSTGSFLCKSNSFSSHEDLRGNSEIAYSGNTSLELWNSRNIHAHPREV